MTPDQIADLQYALQCAANVSGLEWDGSVPPTEFIDRHTLGNIGSDRDRNGSLVRNAPMTGTYMWSRGNTPGKAFFGTSAGKPVLAHEMTHYLQDKAGLRPGSALAAADPEQQKLRRDIEAQAYNVEKLTPFECLTIFGQWKPDLIKAR
jgi:hypothetical protein